MKSSEDFQLIHHQEKTKKIEIQLIRCLTEASENETFENWVKGTGLQLRQRLFIGCLRSVTIFREKDRIDFHEQKILHLPIKKKNFNSKNAKQKQCGIQTYVSIRTLERWSNRRSLCRVAERPS